jgi:rubredoxin
MDNYVCSICGHRYCPATGEPLQAVAPGIEFYLLPPDWACPVCGAGKNEFNKE